MPTRSRVPCMLDKERPLCRRQRASRCWWRGAARQSARPEREREAGPGEAGRPRSKQSWLHCTRGEKARPGWALAILIDPAVTVTVTNSRTSKVERGRQGEHRAGVSPRASEPGRGRGAFSREVMGREGAKLCETGGEVDVTSVLGRARLSGLARDPPPFRRTTSYAPWPVTTSSLRKRQERPGIESPQPGK